MGVLWLAAMILLLAAALALLLAPRWFWLVGAAGVIASQVAIASSWSDARFGTLANILALAAAVHGGAAWGPFGLNAKYQARTTRALAGLTGATPVTAAELEPLPPAVQRYLRFVGVVGQPHTRAFRARFTGRIRGGPDKPWMSFNGEQHSVVSPPVRVFSMQATMFGLPVEAFHAYDGDGARMRVRLLSLFPLVDARGPEFTRTETVTVLNDLCVMAPAALVDRSILWRERDSRSVEATYTIGPHTVRAVLMFGDDGALVDFWSDDRPALAPDGVTFVPQRWSTPIGSYRQQGSVRLASQGEARYAAPSGEYAYIQFDDLSISYDPSPR
jgi:hypothetical protein